MFGRKTNQPTSPTAAAPAVKPELWGDIYTMPGTFRQQPGGQGGGGGLRRLLVVVLIVLGLTILALVAYLLLRPSPEPLPPTQPTSPIATPEPQPTPTPQPPQLATAAERDRTRYRDVREIQAALELYFAENELYPLAPLSLVLGTSSSNVLSAAGFSGASQGAVYLEVVPQNPEPGGSPYLYESLDGSTYTLRFRLEEGTAGLAVGDHEATPRGIDEQPPIAAEPTGPRTVVPPPATLDTDGDGLTDAEEPLLGADAAKPDTDGDGYTDGSEVAAGFDPSAGSGAQMAASAALATYTNERFGYTLRYPTAWQWEAVDEEATEVLFSTGGAEFVEVLVVGNPDKLTAAAWYAAQFPSLTVAEVPQRKVGNLTWALAPDGLTAYLATENSIITLNYNIGTATQVSYYALFSAMVNLMTLDASQVPLPAAAEGVISAP